MIIKIWGGLGNQMFQYAFAKALSEKHNTPAWLDCQDFFRPNRFVTGRAFKLSAYNISLPLATEVQISRLFRCRSVALLERVELKLIKSFASYFRQYIYEGQFTFDAANLRKAAYYEGYWQSYKYFDLYKAQIIEELSLSALPENPEYKETERHIITSNAVSVHIRRGDYVTNSAVLAHHGVLTPAYYEKAVALMSAELENPKFFIFSDDITWVKANMFREIPVVFVDGGSAELDLHLMSLSKHNIIANSTFSWWGAYLNLNKEKIVVAPKNWFNADVDTTDLIPEEWIRL